MLTGQNSIAQNLSEKSIPLIVLKEQDKAVVFEKIYIADDHTEVINDPSVITLILPLSEGKSANFVKPADRESVIIINNSNGMLTITYKSSEGKEKTYPSTEYDELKTYQIRVNIINGKGYKQAFVIDNYDIIKKDDGPVIDIFGGVIPMEVNDYSITLETKVNIPTKVITGLVPFLKIDSWIVVEAMLPGGKSGKFILDTGASGGIVLKQNALPEDTEISALRSIAYSAEGSTEKKGQMQTAEGTVEDDNFLGVAELSSFKFGDINLSDLNVNVLKEFPEFLEKNDIIGIIGIEILKLAEVIRFENINEDKGLVKFMSQGDKQTINFDYHFPLKTAGNLLFVKGSIQNTPMDFLIDIGARRSVIATNIVTDNNLEYSKVSNSGLVGLAGNKTDATEGQFSEIKLENELFENIHLLISSNLFATKAMGLAKTGALLGMSFFSQFKTLEIDFINSELSLAN